jgi:hypothetical protein
MFFITFTIAITFFQNLITHVHFSILEKPRTHIVPTTIYHYSLVFRCNIQFPFFKPNALKDFLSNGNFMNLAATQVLFHSLVIAKGGGRKSCKE